MCAYNLKSYHRNIKLDKPHFFILNKGNNSGKPLLMPCPNCFVILFSGEEEKEHVYWLLYSLWQSKAFYPCLRGSVIPFILLRDVKECLTVAMEKMKANPGQFKKAVEALHSLEAMENKFRQNLKLIQLAKISIFNII